MTSEGAGYRLAILCKIIDQGLYETAREFGVDVHKVIAWATHSEELPKYMIEYLGKEPQ